MTQLAATCLININSVARQHFLRNCYDNFPADTRKALQEAPFNLCEGCLTDFFYHKDPHSHRHGGPTPKHVQQMIDAVRDHLEKENRK